MKSQVTITTALPGLTSPSTAEIRPQSRGNLLKRCFSEGSNVQAGQLFCRRDAISSSHNHGPARVGPPKGPEDDHDERHGESRIDK
jgi:hypothetical protein